MTEAASIDLSPLLFGLFSVWRTVPVGCTSKIKKRASLSETQHFSHSHIGVVAAALGVVDWRARDVRQSASCPPPFSLSDCGFGSEPGFIPGCLHNPIPGEETGSDGGISAHFTCVTCSCIPQETSEHNLNDYSSPPYSNSSFCLNLNHQYIYFPHLFILDLFMQSQRRQINFTHSHVLIDDAHILNTYCCPQPIYFYWCPWWHV